VLARNAHIAEGSEALWAHARARVAAAVTAGHLAPGPQASAVGRAERMS
jgi:hypothetical protein